jgi:hypothetical protein
MRSMVIRILKYTPWSPERRAAASKAVRARAKAAGCQGNAKNRKKKTCTPIEAEDAVNDANRHGAIERWKFASRILEGIRRQQGLVGPPIRVGCGHAHARPWRDKFVAMVRDRL